MRFLTLLLSLCLINPTFADDELLEYPTKPETIKQVYMITGGIGKEEMGMFQTQARNYSLRVKTTIKQGHYISDAWIRVKDSKDELLLQAEMDGPLLYAKLKPGKYKVSAEWNSETQTHTVNIPKNGYREIYFRFNAPKGEGGLDQRGVE